MEVIICPKPGDSLDKEIEVPCISTNALQDWLKQ